MEKCARNKTDNFFDLEAMLGSKKKSREALQNLKEAERFRESDRIAEHEIKKYSDLIVEYQEEIDELSREIESNTVTPFLKTVVNGDYSLTSTCIAKILDISTDYVTRKLKNHVDHIHLPLKYFDVNKILNERSDISTFEKLVYADKELFFSKYSFIEFLESNLYEVGQKEFYEVNVSVFLGKTDGDINIAALERTILSFLNKYTKVYEYETPVSGDVSKSLADFDIDLVRSSTLKMFLERDMVDFKIHGYQQQLLGEYGLNSIDDFNKSEDCLSEERRILTYFNSCKKVAFNPLSYKSIVTIQDVQVNRFVSRFEHTKYHLKLENSARPVALFYFHDFSSFSKINYGALTSCRIDLGNKIVNLNLDTSLIKTNIEKDLNNFLIKNYHNIAERFDNYEQ